MIEIKDLLISFEKLLLSSEIKKQVIIDILYKNINLKIEKEDIKIKNNDLYLNIKPIYKNEILIKKDKILQELELNLGNKAPKEFK
jgi:hypothetical protein